MYSVQRFRRKWMIPMAFMLVISMAISGTSSGVSFAENSKNVDENGAEVNSAVMNTSAEIAMNPTNLEYKDVPKGAFYAQALRTFTAIGTVSPSAEGTFDSQHEMTRGEFAALLAASMFLPDELQDAPFTDMDKHRADFGAVNALYARGLISGYSDDTFRPDQPITRSEVAALLASAFGLGEMPEISAEFQDVPQQIWYAGAVGALVNYRVTSGRTVSHYAPSATVTKGEAITFLYQILYRSFHIDNISGDTVTIDGENYTVVEPLKGLFQLSNLAALQHAKIRFTPRGSEIVSVEGLELAEGNAGSKANDPIVLSGGGATINGPLIVNKDYIALSNLRVNGNVLITQNVRKQLFTYGLIVEGQTLIYSDKTTLPEDELHIVYEKTSFGTLRISKNVRLILAADDEAKDTELNGAQAFEVKKVSTVKILAEDSAGQLTAQQKFDALKEKGIFAGIPDGGNGLDQDMTRAQFAKVAALLLNLDTNSMPVEKTFTDVNLTHWYVEEIDAVKSGMMNGVDQPSSTFGDTGKVTIEQLARILVDVLGLDIDEDAEVEGASDWAQPYIAAAIEAGLIGQISDYASNVTRELLVASAFNYQSQLEQQTEEQTGETIEDPTEDQPNPPIQVTLENGNYDITIPDNSDITGDGNTNIPNLTLNNVESLNLNGDIENLTIQNNNVILDDNANQNSGTGEDNGENQNNGIVQNDGEEQNNRTLTISGTGNIGSLTINNGTINLNHTGTIETFTINGSDTQIQLGSNLQINNLVLPPGMQASELISNYSSIFANITNIGGQPNPSNNVISPGSSSTEDDSDSEPPAAAGPSITSVTYAVYAAVPPYTADLEFTVESENADTIYYVYYYPEFEWMGETPGGIPTPEQVKTGHIAANRPPSTGDADYIILSSDAASFLIEYLSIGQSVRIYVVAEKDGVLSTVAVKNLSIPTH